MCSTADDIKVKDTGNHRRNLSLSLTQERKKSEWKLGNGNDRLTTVNERRKR